MAVASAGPYANNLRLARDRYLHQPLSLNFYRPDTLPDAQPTVSNTEGKSIEVKTIHHNSLQQYIDSMV